MPSRRGLFVALGVLTALPVGLGVAAVVAAARPKKKRKKPEPEPEPKLPKSETRGFVVCPAELGLVPPDTSKLRAGDFVVVTLVTDDRKFAEQTWAQVRSVLAGADSIRVQILGEFGREGIKPIRTDLHGFELGEKIIIARECVFEVLSKPANLRGTILCGVALEGAGYKPVSTKDVQDGSLVQIVVANDQGHGGPFVTEKLIVALHEVSPTSPVLRGIVVETPANTDGHGLTRLSAVEFFRDCVVRRY